MQMEPSLKKAQCYLSRVYELASLLQYSLCLRLLNGANTQTLPASPRVVEQPLALIACGCPVENVQVNAVWDL